MTIVFPKVEAGDQVVLITTRHQKVPWFAGVFAENFFFNRLLVVREATLALTTVGDDAKFHITATGLDGGAAEKAGTSTRRVWHFHNDKPDKAELSADLENEDIPHLFVTTLPDYGAVAKLYGGLFAGKTAVTPEIQALADTVTKGMKDKRARASALYDWVSTHIKYVDIVLGAGGFVPNSAAQVLKSGFGDCKDHVMLLEAMLAAEHIDSSPVLINTSDGRRRLPAAPSPFLFDHLITYVPELDVFTDSTAQYAPFGALPASDSSKQVLVVKSAKLVDTPTIAADANVMKAQTKLTVAADGSAEGSTDIVAVGQAAIEMRSSMANLPKDSEPVFFQQMFGPGSTGTLERGDPEALTGESAIHMRYHVANYIPLPGPGALPLSASYATSALLSAVGWALPPSREHAYYCPSMTRQQVTDLSFPQSIAITALPSSQTVSADGMELKTLFEQPAPGTLRQTVTVRFAHDGPVCSPAYYAKVRDSLFKMNNILKAQVLYK
jgi:hypothetical protein